LTCARTGETLGANGHEFDLEARTWTIPAERMKARKEHKTPLCAQALQILREFPLHGETVFPLSNMAMLELLRGMRPGHTVHGFRSTFMDWAHEQTAFPKIVIDLALAHTISDKVEAAYRRGDLFEKRRKLMEAWARYCAIKPASASDSVVVLGARG
jgi:integrase